VVTPWEWPDPFADLTIDDLIAAQKAVNAGGPWRADSRANDWVGKPIAKALGLDIDSKADKAKIIGALKIWSENGMFKEVGLSNKSTNYKEKPFVEVDEWAVAGKTVIKMKPSTSKSKSQRQNKPGSSPSSNGSTPPPPTKQRINEWADWYKDEGNLRHNENRLNTSVLDDELRDKLQKEVPPGTVDTVFDQVMDIVFAV
jgi:hypothetical protein